MVKKKDIFTELSEKYKVDKKIISIICQFPFMFLRRRIMDPVNEDIVMIHFFGKFRIKRTQIGKKLEKYRKTVELEKRLFKISKSEQRHNV
jgi:hypothetical protein